MNGDIHASADTVNAVLDSFQSNVLNPNGLARSANELLLQLSRHMNNDDAGDGIGTSEFHAVSSGMADMENTIIASSANEQDPLSALRLIADLHRAYEAHRIDTSYHDSADTTSGGTLPVLPALFSSFNAQLQDDTPTAPDTANPGAVRLIHSAGFKEG